MSKEAIKLAMDNLIAEYHMENSSFAKRVDNIFKEALAEQPSQQEPVAWLFTNVQSGDIEASTDPYDKQGEREYWHSASLYTSPPAQRKPLTYAELRRIANDCGLGSSNVTARAQVAVDSFARAIEAAHQIGVEK